MLNMITEQFVVLVPIVVGLVQVFRKAGLPTKLAPMTAIILGIACAVGLASYDFTSVLAGVVVGLTASGLYSGVKTVTSS